MNLSVFIPDDLAQRLGVAGESMERRVLEAFAAEEYRAGRLSRSELRRVLGLVTRSQLDEFLKARAIYESTSLADFESDRADLDRLGF